MTSRAPAISEACGGRRARPFFRLLPTFLTALFTAAFDRPVFLASYRPS
jgi:hypothetical protein